MKLADIGPDLDDEIGGLFQVGLLVEFGSIPR
jgi:hypothetical protein